MAPPDRPAGLVSGHRLAGADPLHGRGVGAAHRRAARANACTIPPPVTLTPADLGQDLRGLGVGDPQLVTRQGGQRDRARADLRCDRAGGVRHLPRVAPVTRRSHSAQRPTWRS
ncbi:MAG: hypothetical protein ACRDYX_20810 [Egibacteraceae bacterium]